MNILYHQKPTHFHYFVPKVYFCISCIYGEGSLPVGNHIDKLQLLTWSWWTSKLYGTVIMEVAQGMFPILNVLVCLASLKTRKEQIIHEHSIAVCSGAMWRHLVKAPIYFFFLLGYAWCHLPLIWGRITFWGQAIENISLQRGDGDSNANKYPCLLFSQSGFSTH